MLSNGREASQVGGGAICHYLDANGEEEKEILGELRTKGMGLKKGLAVARGTGLTVQMSLFGAASVRKGRSWMMGDEEYSLIWVFYDPRGPIARYTSL